MPLKTVYCLQPFRHEKGRFVQGELRRYKDEGAAIRAVDSILMRSCGVIVFAIDEDANAGVYGTPHVILSKGKVPEMEFA